MRKFLLVICVIVIIILIALIAAISGYKTLIKERNFMQEKDLNGKSVAMIIAFRDFRDEEYFIPKQILESAGARITTVSSSLGKAVGKLGGDTDVNILLEDLNVLDYDAILFIGGPGAYNYFDNETAHKIAKTTVENDKILGAICIAPAILAKAGVLKGKKATVWSSLMDKSAVKILEEGGAIFQSEPVVVDGKIITASGPLAAKEFANAIINLLSFNKND